MTRPGAVEHGRFDLLPRLRLRAGRGIPGELLDHIHIFRLWVAVPVAYLLGGGLCDERLPGVTLSSGGILLERVGRGPKRIQL